MSALASARRRTSRTITDPLAKGGSVVRGRPFGPRRVRDRRRSDRSRRARRRDDRRVDAADGRAPRSRSPSTGAPAPRRRSSEVIGGDLGKAGELSLPVTLIILTIAFGSLTGGRCAAAARPQRCDRRLRTGGADQSHLAWRTEPGRGDPDDRARRRRRLLALLPAPRARGAGEGPRHGVLAADRGCDVGTGGARLRRDRDGRDGRACSSAAIRRSSRSPSARSSWSRSRWSRR